jgi:Protein of unknown function (DUF429)
MDVRVIAIDWSGAKHGAAKSICWAEFREGVPFERPTAGWSREQIVRRLIDTCEELPRTVIGIDFAFSFPAWFVSSSRCPDVESLWSKAADCGENWLSSCLYPFWGRPGKTKPPARETQGHYRRTELEVAQLAGMHPKSVFQTNGAGAVGTGSIRGMPHLRRLADAGFAIWPFHEIKWPRVVEIWPRLLSGPVTKSRKEDRTNYVAKHHPSLPPDWQQAAEDSEDAFDAIVSACVMNKHVQQLASLEKASDPTILLEGAIWAPHGVA